MDTGFFESVPFDRFILVVAKANAPRSAALPALPKAAPVHVVPALAGSAAAPVPPVAPVVPRGVPDVPRMVPDVPGPAPVVARVVPAAAPAVPVLGSVEVAAPETSPAAAPSVPVDDWVLVNPESSGVAAAESTVVATEASTNGSETAAANGSEAAPHGSEAAATEPEICCICQDAMIVHQQTLTPIFCGHVFHASCLGEWRFCARKTHLQCPYRCEHSMCLGHIISAQNFVGPKIRKTSRTAAGCSHPLFYDDFACFSAFDNKEPQ